MNTAPLYYAPEYAAPPYDVGANQYWPDKPKNHTLLNGRMMEEVVSVNAIYEYRTPVDVVLSKKYPGAKFAVFNVNGLVSHASPLPILPLNCLTNYVCGCRC